MLNKSNEVLFSPSVPETKYELAWSISKTNECSSGCKSWRPTFWSWILTGHRLFRWVRHATVRPSPGGVTSTRGFIVAHLYRRERKKMHNFKILALVNVRLWLRRTSVTWQTEDLKYWYSDHPAFEASTAVDLCQVQDENWKQECCKNWPLRYPTMNYSADVSLLSCTEFYRRKVYTRTHPMGRAHLSIRSSRASAHVEGLDG